MEEDINKTKKSNNSLLEKIIPEVGFIEQPQPLNINQHKKILDQMSNSVCRIAIGNKTGTGFLCLIPFPKIENRLKVLITCNHVFNDIAIGNKIEVIFDNGMQKEIIIDESRRVYTKKEYDITIIELKDNEFNKKYYLGIDDDLFLKDEIKINQQIYIIHYPKGKEVTSNNGTIQNIIKNEIMYFLSTYEGSSGAPIFNLNNFKVIAIHCGYIDNKNNKYNIGELIKIPIIDYYQKYNLKDNKIKEIKEEKKINEINIILEILKDDINEIIYFLDNTEKHDNLKELNENNVKLYINKKEYKYTKCFKPDKEGIYKIKLLIFIDMTNWSYIFYNCERIKKITFANFNINNATDMIYMFTNCHNISTLPVISKWNTINVTNMSDIFSGCSTLLTLPDISKWNTNNVTNMSSMFSGCSTLSTLPNISKWNTNNVINMSDIFSGCSTLLSLPDISKWKTNNVIHMSYMFNHCSKLSTLPDISKWNTSNVTNMSGMFSDCSNLSSLPDISKWNTNNVTNMSCMFYYCSNLTILPNISKWNTNNVTKMTLMFTNCSSLSSLPDISKWNTNNVTNMGYMFSDCYKLSTLPDISKWNTNNVTKMSGMFFKCYSLSTLPDISKWNTNNVTDIKDIFSECFNLKNIPSKFREKENDCIIF